MAVPELNQLKAPAIHFFAETEASKVSENDDVMTTHTNLTEAGPNRLIPSGIRCRWQNRVPRPYWAPKLRPVTSVVAMIPLALVLLNAGILASSAADVDFAKEIKPIFDKSCIECHGPEKQKGKLRLDSREAALKGGKDGPAIVPKEADKSDLYRRIILPKSDDDVMPNKGDLLTKAQTDLIRDWINQGAPWPETSNSKEGVPAPVTTLRRETPKVPMPELPKDFQPGAGEGKAIAKLAQAGITVRPIAMNVPWREANLSLQGTNVTDSVIAPLKDITSLVELNLARTKVTDTGLESIGNLPHLQGLHLELTGITDAGLAKIKGLSSLVYLNLYGTAVTDAGLDHLKGMKYLHNLYLFQSKVTQEGVTNLNKVLPGLDISTGRELNEMVTKDQKQADKKDTEKAEKK